ncbi:MAG: D-glycero-beta-D-manno-heptose-7-phosphate kinase [Deltaproteobacteria bacterium]|nr:D-glycero-beta-D-manno-heptose-7-phosphate kinase [Deltaproteobacteria bacterium]
MNEAGFTARAFGYLERFASCRILVVGDIMLDEYVWGNVGRISPEAPVPVVAVTRDTRALGGAANVAVNIAALRAKVRLAGLVGADSPGREIVRMLSKSRIGVSGIVADRNRPTTVKTRVIAHNQQVVRVDREKKEPPDERAREDLRKEVRAAIREADGVVLSDYRKGVLSRELVEDVVAAARRNGVFIAVDPKRTDFSFYRGVTLITPNKSETEAALGGRDLSGDAEIWEGGKALLRKCDAKAILITRGEEGMSLVERRSRSFFHIPALARQVFDVTGAGDTVIGTLAVGMGAGAPLRDAALLANIAAGVVVGEVGTVPITIDKLSRALRIRERERDVAQEERPGTSRAGR